LVFGENCVGLTVLVFSVPLVGWFIVVDLS